MKRVRFVAVVLALAVCSGALAAQPQVNGLAKWIPAESLLFAGYDGNNAAARQTALSKIFAEPEVKALLDGPLAAFGKHISAEAVKKGDLDVTIDTAGASVTAATPDGLVHTPISSLDIQFDELFVYLEHAQHER